MAYSVDTLIDTLGIYASRAAAASRDYAWRAKTLASQTQVEIPNVMLPYVVAPPFDDFGADDGSSGTVGGSGTNSNTLATQLSAQLKQYYNTFFPDISSKYAQWIALLKNAIDNGVPLTLDNHLLNAQAQAFDAAVGVRAGRKIRSGYAARGYSLPPGGMVGTILDDTDSRTEVLMKGAIGFANTASETVVANYKALLSASIEMADQRIAAINAMSSLIATGGSMSGSQADIEAAQIRMRRTAIAAAVSMYRSQLRVDEINTRFYQQNQAFAAEQKQKTLELHFRNEQSQVEAAMASADAAVKIAQATYAALQAFVSSSTVGFE